jgi:hypothetical protein
MATPHHTTVGGPAAEPATCSSSQVGWWGRAFTRLSAAVHDGAVVGADLVRFVTEEEARSPGGPCLLPAARHGEEAVYLGSAGDPAVTPWMVEALTEAAFRMEGGEDFAAYARDCGPAFLQRVVEGALAMAGIPLGFIERRERAILVTYRTLRTLGFA